MANSIRDEDQSVAFIPMHERVYRRLRIVRLFAIADAILLILLVSSALTGFHEAVHILGPLHGINFLLLLVIAATAAIDGLWGWWFPLVLLVTAGPIGAFIGERRISRRIAAQDTLEEKV